MVFVATALPFLLLALGQPLRVGVPVGNVRKLAYDADGNVLAVKDQHYDVQFAYRGMGRLATRTQEGTTVKFEYDTEEALVAIHNEAGAVYGFALDKVGNVRKRAVSTGSCASTNATRAAM